MQKSRGAKLKKICILSTVNLKHMTLVSLYTEYLDKNNIPFDIIYIDKYHENEQTTAKNAYKFDLYIKRDWSLPRKFLSYWKFKAFATRILMEKNYDFIITWNVFTAFMFSDVLIKHFDRRFCLNIRDVGTKWNFIINQGLRKAIMNSAFSTISSDGFRKVLPPHNYVTIHSLNMKILSNCTPHTMLKSTDKPIIITYIGYLCYYENCYRLIDQLANDKRYELRFYGQGSNLIENYTKENGIHNVFCIGKFEPNQTASLIQDADIIYNLYGVGDVNLDNALSIKLYYAIYLNVPILVFKNTYMEEISQKCGIGYAIENDGFAGLADKLYAWYRNLDQTDIFNKCTLFKEEVKIRNQEHQELLNKYLS